MRQLLLLNGDVVVAAAADGLHLQLNWCCHLDDLVYCMDQLKGGRGGAAGAGCSAAGQGGEYGLMLMVMMLVTRMMMRLMNGWRWLIVADDGDDYDDGRVMMKRMMSKHVNTN